MLFYVGYNTKINIFFALRDNVQTRIVINGFLFAKTRAFGVNFLPYQQTIFLKHPRHSMMKPIQTRS